MRRLGQQVGNGDRPETLFPGGGHHRAEGGDRAGVARMKAHDGAGMEASGDPAGDRGGAGVLVVEGVRRRSPARRCAPGTPAGGQADETGTPATRKRRLVTGRGSGGEVSEVTPTP